MGVIIIHYTGSKHNIAMLGNRASAMQLGSDTVTASDHVWVLGVTFLSNLTLEKHVSKTCAAGFYWLRQLRSIRRSLGEESAATLVHAFVTSRIDYCYAVYAGAPKTIADKLQRVFSATARAVSDIRKFNRGLSTLLHDRLHWLDVSERVTFKLGLVTYRCLHGQTPRYLAKHIAQPLKSHLDIDYVLPTDTGSL